MSNAPVLPEKEDNSIEEPSPQLQDPIEQEPIPELGTSERDYVERKLVRKLDMRLLPTIIVIFIMNYIDRNGVTTARLQGLETDLGLNDLKYEVILSVLYVTYCPAQIPSNMFLNWIKRPSLYIGGCVVAWGLTSALTGVTHNYGGILAIRMFIGLPESAFYPGAIYLLSRWYTKKELAFRSCILYGGLLISNAFGALMAAGILNGLEGARGIRGWRWLFYIEGAITMFVGLNAMWLLPDYPQNTRWMSPFEQRLAQARLAEDAGEADQDTEADSPMKGLLMAIKDPKVLIFCVMTTSQLLGLSFVAKNTYMHTFRFSKKSPPWIFATILCCLSAWHADRTGERFFHIAGWWWGVIIGFIIALCTMNTAGRYVSMFLMASGYCGFAMTLVWVSNAIPRPPAMGSFVWKAEWGPEYHQSMIVSLLALALASVLALVIRQMIVRDNKKLDADEKAIMEGTDRTRVEEAARLEGITFEQAMERRKGFRYLY
ncbi:MFS general substrate transporter [Dendrothele bispora CBS 962.96]|uniref:MFS general substrate transporter n=1 Tax=Dendrothele bispora (strain CBS 962.96) TaxID=1314807 RepID=A0A4S8LTU7_DENBC|nr:MFS general substrate transporter [Dendrothele bispora CBS 962.96]